MLGYEFYKILCKKKIWIIFFVCVMFRILFSMQTETVMFDGFNSNVYHYYMEKLEGKYTAEKHEWIKNEYERLNELINNEESYEEQYKKNEIDAKTFKKISDDIKSAKNRVATVEYIVLKSQYFSELEEPAEYFYDIDIADYLENMDVDIFMIVVMIVSITLIYTDDYNCGTVYLVKSSKYGTKKLFNRKLFCTMIISLICGFFFPGIEFIVKYKVLDLGNLNAGIQSLMVMKESHLHLSILQYIGLTIITRMFYTAILGIVIMLAAQVSHQDMVTYMFVLAFVYIPQFVSDYAGRVVQDMSMYQGLGAYAGYCSYHKIFGLPNVVFSGIIYGVLGMVMLYAGRRKQYFTISERKNLFVAH